MSFFAGSDSLDTKTTLHRHHGTHANNFALDFHTDSRRLTKSNKHSSETQLTTKQDKKEKQESDQQRNISRTEESDNMWRITGSIIWIKEKEPPEYETIAENTEEDTLLTTEEKNHQTKQEIKDLQGTVKSLQKEIITHYTLMQN